MQPSLNNLILRYSQCWEDADILLEGLEIQPGDVCLSIASGGDNTLALLAASPREVIAIDTNPAQLACLELRAAAFRELEHAEMLELLGSRPSCRRLDLYQSCRTSLSAPARSHWDARREAIQSGIAAAGRFEHYFGLFRRWILPLLASPAELKELIHRDAEYRHEFLVARMNSIRWRIAFRGFFSRAVMQRLGRDSGSFRFVQGDIIHHLEHRFFHVMTNLDPQANPYLHWILFGIHGAVLPFALREENFESIRGRLDRLVIRQQSLASFLRDAPDRSIDAFNLSDVFEYISEMEYHRLLSGIAQSGRNGARVAYWNMMVERRSPDAMADNFARLDERAAELFIKDKAFFYRAFILENVVGVHEPALCAI